MSTRGRHWQPIRDVTVVKGTPGASSRRVGDRRRARVRGRARRGRRASAGASRRHDDAGTVGRSAWRCGEPGVSPGRSRHCDRQCAVSQELNRRECSMPGRSIPRRRAFRDERRRAALRNHRRHRDPRDGGGAWGGCPTGFPEVRCANPGARDRSRGVRRRRARRRARRARAGCSAAGAAGRRASTCCAHAAPSAASRCSRSAARRSPDAEMTALSTAPVGAVAQAGEYLRHGDVDNVEQLLRFLADTFLLEGYGFAPPREVRRPRRLRARASATCRSSDGARAATTRRGRRSASASTARTG